MSVRAVQRLDKYINQDYEGKVHVQIQVTDSLQQRLKPARYQQGKKISWNKLINALLMDLADKIEKQKV